MYIHYTTVALDACSTARAKAIAWTRHELSTVWPAPTLNAFTATGTADASPRAVIQARSRSGSGCFRAIFPCKSRSTCAFASHTQPMGCTVRAALQHKRQQVRFSVTLSFIQSRSSGYYTQEKGKGANLWCVAVVRTVSSQSSPVNPSAQTQRPSRHAPRSEHFLSQRSPSIDAGSGVEAVILLAYASSASAVCSRIGIKDPGSGVGGCLSSRIGAPF